VVISMVALCSVTMWLICSTLFVPILLITGRRMGIRIINWMILLRICKGVLLHNTLRLSPLRKMVSLGSLSIGAMRKLLLLILLILVKKEPVVRALMAVLLA